jgi:hypothetical protein
VIERGFMGFALRLMITGARASSARLTLMVSGVAVGVALLIGALGVAPAIQARQLRVLAREPVRATGASRHHNYLLLTSTEDQAGDRTLMRYRVAAVGVAPIPRGLTQAPRDGDLFVSPALQDLLSTPLGKLVRPRLPGRVAGTIGPEGLLYPDELVAYSGVPRRSLPLDAVPTAAFGHKRGPGGPVDFRLKLAVVMVALGLLVPILVFIATSTRLSAAYRERRLAAIRLVGATPAEVRLIAAVESGSAAALGSLLGVVLFFLLRPAVGAISLAGLRWFPSDVAPPVMDVVAVLILTPVLSVAVAMVSLRRLVVSPLGVVRSVGSRSVCRCFLCW